MAIPYDTAQKQAGQTLPQRAKGSAMLSAQGRDGRSVLRDLSMSGSSKLLFPRTSSPALDAVVLNSAGGVTGGDAFSLRATATDGTRLRMTTQAAERIYRAPDQSAPGRIDTRLQIDAGATLHWLPQETILFDGAALDRRLRIEMAPDAALISCETLIFGRAAMGETVCALRLNDRVDLIRDGALVFADRLRLNGDAAAHLARPGVMAGGLAVASVLVAMPEAESLLAPLRAALPEGAGVSMPCQDVVFLRMVAADGFVLRQGLIPVLHLLVQGDLPRPWML